MIRLQSRVNAFSLIEMLVVLLLSSIVSGMIFFCFYTISTYQITFARRYHQINNNLIFHFKLRSDIEDCDLLETKNGELYCRFPNGYVKYAFTPPVMVRQQSSKLDTAFYLTSDAKFYWQEEPITNQNHYLDKLVIEVNDGDRKVTIAIKKKYDRSTLLKLDSVTRSYE